MGRKHDRDSTSTSKSNVIKAILFGIVLAGYALFAEIDRERTANAVGGGLTVSDGASVKAEPAKAVRQEIPLIEAVRIPGPGERPLRSVRRDPGSG